MRWPSLQISFHVSWLSAASVLSAYRSKKVTWFHWTNTDVCFFWDQAWLKSHRGVLSCHNCFYSVAAQELSMNVFVRLSREYVRQQKSSRWLDNLGPSAVHLACISECISLASKEMPLPGFFFFFFFFFNACNCTPPVSALSDGCNASWKRCERLQHIDQK